MYNKNALNNRLRIKRIMVLFGCVIFCFVHIWMAENVNASIKSERDLYFLSLAQGSEICYKNYAKDSISAGNMGFDYLSIFKDGYDGQSNSDFLVTTQVGNKIADGSSDKAKSDLSCKQLFRGWKDGEGDQAGGLINGFGYSAPNNAEGMGYVFGSGEAADVAVISLNLEKASSLQIGVGENRILCKGEQDDNGKWIIKNCNGKIELKSSDTVIASVEYDGTEWDGREKRHKCDGKYVETFPTESESACNVIPKRISGTKVHENLFEELEWMDETGVSQRDEGFKTGSLLYGFEWFFKKALTAWGNGYVAWGNLVAGTHNIEVNYKNNECDTDNTICFSTHATKGGTNNGVNTYVLANENPSYASGVMLYNIMGKNVNTNLPHTLDGNSVAYHWKASNGNNAYIYSLYYYYLLNLRKKFDKISFGGDGLCWSESEGQSRPEGVEYAFKNTKDQWCSINLNNQIVSGHEVAYVNNAGTLEWGSIMNVLDWFNEPSNYDFDEDEYLNMELKGGFLDPETADIDASTMPADPNASGTVAATCQSTGGAGAVGWIVCSLLDWMGNSATDVYTRYVEPKLKINPQLFQTLEGGSENPTQNAWGTFQTIANVIFIILLLIVIFSQLTGIGIDNYGIKRILPKLIVVAILVNLSYLICVISVDLSNILGSSLKGLFDSLGASLGDISVNVTAASTPALGNDSWVPVVLLGLMTTAAIVGAASVFFNPGLLLTLLISAIGVIISVLFIFALFVIREAAVVVLTVVAPIAFVCYALPNTKKAFDKWLKAFQGLLLVYPICGLLIGGGDYISRLLIKVQGEGGEGWFQLIAAMVVGIAPIFFIPTLLKGSFAAMGNIGAKVSGIGKTLGGKATSRLTNSEINKNAQRMGAERRGRLRAGLNKDGEMTGLARTRLKMSKRLSTMPVIGGIGRGQIKSQAAKISAAKKDLSANESANAMMMNAMASAGMAKAGGAEQYYSGLLEEAAAKGDKSGFDAVLAAATESGYMKPKEVAKMVRDMSNSGRLDKLNDTAWWQRMANKHNSVMSTDYELLAWARRGGEAGTGRQLGDYGEFASAKDSRGEDFIKIDEIKDEDIAKMSGGSLAGMIAAGKINNTMAQNVLAKSTGLTQDKKVMLGAVASGAATDKSIQSAGHRVASIPGHEGTDVGEGAKIFRNDSMALMNHPDTGTHSDGTPISSIHTENTNNNDGWGGYVASAQDVEGWMAPQAQEVVVRGQGGGAFGNPGAPGGGGADGSGAPGGGSEELNRYNQFLESREGENRQARERREKGEEIFTVPQEENFDGETRVNRETGKERTSKTFDLYPRQIKENGERENNAEYTARIQHNAQLRRGAEVAPPAPQMHFYDPYRKSQVDPPRGAAIPSDIKERAKLFHRRPDENPEAYKTRLGSDNPWG